jgi:hypothetical protein
MSKHVYKSLVSFPIKLPSVESEWGTDDRTFPTAPSPVTTHFTVNRVSKRSIALAAAGDYLEGTGGHYAFMCGRGVSRMRCASSSDEAMKVAAKFKASSAWTWMGARDSKTGKSGGRQEGGDCSLRFGEEQG